MNLYVIISIESLFILLLLIACRSWRRAAMDYRKANDMNRKGFIEAQAQVAALQRIVKDLNGIYSLLNLRQSQRSTDQFDQLELLTKVTDDLVQRELRIRTDLNRILERPALTSTELKAAIEEALA